jgi:arylsulfatase A-like enzyme
MRREIEFVATERPLRGRVQPLVAALLIAALALACPSAEPEPPTVILVVIDTLRRDHLGLYGYDRDTSPALDRLAREATVFEHCLATSSWTKPSTVSLLTGLYPPSHGVHRKLRAPRELVFVSEVLRDHGFATAAFSGNVYVSPIFGMNQGFDKFRKVPTHGIGTYPDSAQILDEAVRWLDLHPEGPRFLYVHLMNVHGPYESTDAQRRRFRVEPRRNFEFKNALWKRIVRGEDLAARSEVREAHLNDLRERYDAAIAHTDAALAHFFETLAANGTLDRSLLIVTSDHGEELFEHGGFGHRRTLFGEVLEIPLLIRDPDLLDTPRQISTPVSLVDLPATILERVGLLGSEAVFGDGRSLLPLMRGESPGAGFVDRLLVAELDEDTAGRAWLVQQWPLRLIETEIDYTGRVNAVDLFDVETDPGEQVDLSLRRADAVDRLSGAGRSLRETLRGATRDNDAVEIDPKLERQLEALGYAG